MGVNPAKNEWELRFGNKRRRIDRDLLAEVERQIAEEEQSIVNPTPLADRNDPRQRIARALGRPA